ncbi:hypothetical protein ENUP19_0115G0005 [Entamoeba nuttalli]|uniref:protein disulfide-isomerase n=2 Tax=Entamoeba nuttalli TaxID=412467 RepID=K2H696_ENTNP|nr:thioredoxin, putative [Entamoeba nuttalli P19]EKE38019.1 thioredoxin, putative [Entamoeba nuttalli P19]|eukprot:XP_008859645.1 thioredoxin, putative [Entamoeba nuttalli P19]
MIFIIYLISFCIGSEIYRITPKTFEKVTTQTDILIRFCPMYENECRETQSAYEGLVDTFEEFEDISFGEFDCTKNADWCDEHGFKRRFPIYVAYTTGPLGIQIFPDDHNVNELSKFINTVFNISKIQYTTLLTDKTFNKTILQDPNSEALVLFYDYWCPFGREYSKYLEKVAKNYGNEKDLVIARVDCSVYPKLCKQQKATMLPQFEMFTFNNKSPFWVYPERSIEGLIKFINERFHKNRDIDGLKPSDFGTWREFDEVAKGYLHSNDKEKRKTKCGEFILGSVYIDIMKKIDQLNSDDFIPSEISQLEFKLRNQLPYLSPKEIDDLQRRINVLKKFIY